VLGYYSPRYDSDWDAKRMGKLFTDETYSIGFMPHYDPKHGPLETVDWFSKALHAEMRTYTFDTKKAEDWHQDGDTTQGADMNCGIVTWASSSPTEIQYKGKIYQSEPRQLVWFDNKLVQHRRPMGCKPYRWLFRQRVTIINAPDIIKGYL